MRLRFQRITLTAHYIDKYSPYCIEIGKLTKNEPSTLYRQTHTINDESINTHHGAVQQINWAYLLRNPSAVEFLTQNLYDTRRNITWYELSVNTNSDVREKLCFSYID